LSYIVKRVVKQKALVNKTQMLPIQSWGLFFKKYVTYSEFGFRQQLISIPATAHTISLLPILHNERRETLLCCSVLIVLFCVNCVVLC